MKNKLIIRIFYIIIFLYILLSVMYNVSAKTLSEMQSDIEKFKQHGENSNITIDDSVVEPFVDLGSILTLIGTGVMVGITAFMGIKYLTSGPEAQAKLKTQLIGVLVSGIVIFGAYSIWKIVISIASTF